MRYDHPNQTRLASLANSLDRQIFVHRFRPIIDPKLPDPSELRKDHDTNEGVDRSIDPDRGIENRLKPI
jgi:hypothetical protein